MSSTATNTITLVNIATEAQNENTRFQVEAVLANCTLSFCLDKVMKIISENKALFKSLDASKYPLTTMFLAQYKPSEPREFNSNDNKPHGLRHIYRSPATGKLMYTVSPYVDFGIPRRVTMNDYKKDTESGNKAFLQRLQRKVDTKPVNGSDN